MLRYVIAGSQTDEDFFSMTEATPIKQEELLSMPALQDDEGRKQRLIQLAYYPSSTISF
jgi:hypothetical protein